MSADLADKYHNFFRNEDHPKYMECQDQILRNFLNGLIIHKRGVREDKRPVKKD